MELLQLEAEFVTPNERQRPCRFIRRGQTGEVELVQHVLDTDQAELLKVMWPYGAMMATQRGSLLAAKQVRFHIHARLRTRVTGQQPIWRSRRRTVQSHDKIMLIDFGASASDRLEAFPTSHPGRVGNDRTAAPFGHVPKKIERGEEAHELWRDAAISQEREVHEASHRVRRSSKRRCC